MASERNRARRDSKGRAPALALPLDGAGFACTLPSRGTYGSPPFPQARAIDSPSHLHGRGGNGGAAAFTPRTSERTSGYADAEAPEEPRLPLWPSVSSVSLW